MTVRAVAVLAGCVLITACPALAGCGSSPGHPAASPGSASAGSGSPAAARYLAIALPANHRLDQGFDHLSGEDKSDLAASRADLLGIAATERQFDKDLLGLRLPDAAAHVAGILVQVNEQRARLTTAAAASTSLAQLRGYEQRLTAANVPVEQAVRLIRAQLGLPPPDTN